jgi:hypothetical protein
MGENFSGSCIVTCRNSLIHIGATTATKSERFDAEGVPPCWFEVAYRRHLEALASPPTPDVEAQRPAPGIPEAG